MRKIILITLLIIICGFTVAHASSSIPATLTTNTVVSEKRTGPITKKLSPEDIQRLKNGEVIVHSPTGDSKEKGNAVAIGIIKADPQQIWRTILDYDRYEEFMPKTKENRVTFKEGNRIDSLVILDLGFGLPDIQHSVIHYFHPAKNLVTWKLDTTKRADYVTRTDGYWQLEPLGPAETLVEYNLIVELDIPLLGGLVNRIVKSLGKDDLPNVIKRMRQRVEGGNEDKVDE